MSEYENITYRLRAGSPMPVSGIGNFVIHSFMAAKFESEVDTCAERLLASSDFRGQGGLYSSASYNRLPVTGNPIYKATENKNELYVQEYE